MTQKQRLLYREQFGQSFAYNDNKNLVSAANLSTQKSGMEYDDADNLSEVQYGNGGKVKYAYDDYDRLTGVRYDDEPARWP